ncbi:zinc finger protein 182-like [Ambystoma mexicanum]|uniref:zinc finger protein 182-like n=1 Tax=Ambystoma mexicanum TaxID=8296 RepID=UPI0037E877AA
MSQHDESNETPIAFHDVAAYFCEEDWNLMHQWQKELYTSVMQEIHQALITLGYQIINQGTLLRVSKGGDPFVHDHQEAKRREFINDPASLSYLPVNPDILVRIQRDEESCCRLQHGLEKTETNNNHGEDRIAACIYSLGHHEKEELYLMEQKDVLGRCSNACLSGDLPANSDFLIGLKKDKGLCVSNSQITEGTKRSGGVNPGDLHANSDFLIGLKKDKGLCVSNSQITEGTKRSGGVNPGDLPANSDFLIGLKKDKGLCLPDSKITEGTKSSSCVSTGDILRNSDFLNELKKDEDLCPMDYQITEGTRTSDYLATGNGTINTYGNEGESLIGHKISSPCNMSSPIVKIEGVQCQDNAKNPGNQFCFETNHPRGEETTQSEGGFLDSANTVLYWRRPKLDVPDAFSHHDSDLRDFNLPTCPENAHERFRPYQCNECGLRFGRKVHLITHQITHTGESGDTPYQCTECETSFSQKMHLITHQKIHLGKSAHQSTDSDKSFKKRSDRNVHQTDKLNAEERPHKCVACEKRYTCKPHLLRHMKTHSGEKPFQCNQCGLRYVEKGTLTKHRKKHHSSSMQGDAVKPQEPHATATLYKCAKCEKCFSLLNDLRNHERTHMENIPNQCLEPKRLCETIGQLCGHELTNKEERSYECPECGKKFRAKKNVIRHLRTHKPREERMESKTGTSNPGDLENFTLTFDSNNELVFFLE